MRKITMVLSLFVVISACALAQTEPAVSNMKDFGIVQLTKDGFIYRGESYKKFTAIMAANISLQTFSVQAKDVKKITYFQDQLGRTVMDITFSVDTEYELPLYLLLAVTHKPGSELLTFYW